MNIKQKIEAKNREIAVKIDAAQATRDHPSLSQIAKNDKLEDLAREVDILKADRDLLRTEMEQADDAMMASRGYVPVDGPSVPPHGSSFGQVNQKIPTRGNGTSSLGYVAASSSRPATFNGTPIHALDDGGFKGGIGEMLGAMRKQNRGEGTDPRLAPLQMRAAAIGSSLGSTGGFAVPPQFYVRALYEDVDDTVLLRYCDKIPVTSSECTVPSFVDDDHSASSPFGISWNMVAEHGSIGTAQGLLLKALGIKVSKVIGYFRISNEWISDAHIEMQGRVDVIFRRSLRHFVENQLWNGLGGAYPVGALTGSGALTIDKEPGQAADTLHIDNILNMWARLTPGSHARAIWACNQSAFPELARLFIPHGAGGTHVGNLQASAIAGEPPMAIFGRPLHMLEQLPALGTSGDIVLFDPQQYVMADRGDMVIESSPHVRFENDESAVRCKLRYTGLPASTENFTPTNGDSCGWLVKIETR